MKAPKCIRVGHEIYEIEFTDNIESDSDGQCFRHEGKIRIRPELSSFYERTVVMHESLHAITMRTGLRDRMGDKRDEEIVTVLGDALVEFIRDNPELIKYIVAK